MAEYPSKAGVVVGYRQITVDKAVLQSCRHSDMISNTLQGALKQAYNILFPTERANIEGYKNTYDINFTSFDYEAIKLFRRVAFN
jgi:hypothetical protein